MEEPEETLAHRGISRRQLLLILDTLRDHGQSQASAECDHRANDRFRVSTAPDPFDEAFIDLDLVHRQSLQPSQTRITGVDRNRDPQLLQTAETVDACG